MTTVVNDCPCGDRELDIFHIERHVVVLNIFRETQGNLLSRREEVIIRISGQNTVHYGGIICIAHFDGVDQHDGLVVDATLDNRIRFKIYNIITTIHRAIGHFHTVRHQRERECQTIR